MRSTSQVYITTGLGATTTTGVFSIPSTFETAVFAGNYKMFYQLQRGRVFLCCTNNS